MSSNIVKEVLLLVHSCLLGVVLTFIYDGIIILRKLVRHSDIFISLEDLLFWMVCAVSVFYMLYEENNGILRWFAVAGAGVGMLLYKITFSPLVVSVSTKILGFLLRVISEILGIAIKPVILAGRKLNKGRKLLHRKSGKIAKNLKNRLTERIKALKMILCKQ